MKEALRLLVIVLISIMAVGCAKAKQVPWAVDYKTKNMQPPSGKALVYVLRPYARGVAVAGVIIANEEYIGMTKVDTYVYAILNPGEYKFRVSGFDNDSEIIVNLEADQTYYIYQIVYMNPLTALLSGFTRLKLVDKEEGRKLLKRCHLSDKLGENIVH